MEQPVPGQALVLCILLQPNPARGGGSEWRVGEVVQQAVAQYGVTYPFASASTTLRQRLEPKGLVKSRKGVRNSTLFSLTEEVCGPRSRRSGLLTRGDASPTAARGARRAVASPQCGPGSAPRLTRQSRRWWRVVRDHLTAAAVATRLCACSWGAPPRSARPLINNSSSAAWLLAWRWRPNPVPSERMMHEASGGHGVGNVREHLGAAPAAHGRDATKRHGRAVWCSWHAVG